MAYANGRIPTSALTAIGGGLFLESRAANAWFAAKAAVTAELGVSPVITSPDGAYRTYDRQVYWKQYWVARGKPGNAAAPGYSNHGLGISIDIYNISAFNLAKLTAIMARYGFSRNVPQESWHFTHNGSIVSAGNVGTKIPTTTTPTIKPLEQDMYRISDGSAIYLITSNGLRHLTPDENAGLAFLPFYDIGLKNVQQAEGAVNAINREKLASTTWNTDLGNGTAAQWLKNTANEATAITRNKELSTKISAVGAVDTAAITSAVSTAVAAALANVKVTASVDVQAIANAAGEAAALALYKRLEK